MLAPEGRRESSQGLRVSRLPLATIRARLRRAKCQVIMDEELLARLDRDQETQRDGRSAVLRRAVSEYLKRRRELEIATSYTKAYGRKAGLGSEFKGWEDEGQWTNE